MKRRIAFVIMLAMTLLSTYLASAFAATETSSWRTSGLGAVAEWQSHDESTGNTRETFVGIMEEAYGPRGGGNGSMWSVVYWADSYGEEICDEWECWSPWLGGEFGWGEVDPSKVSVAKNLSVASLGATTLHIESWDPMDFGVGEELMSEADARSAEIAGTWVANGKISTNRYSWREQYDGGFFMYRSTGKSRPADAVVTMDGTDIGTPAGAQIQKTDDGGVVREDPCYYWGECY